PGQRHRQSHGRTEDDELDDDEAPELYRRRGGRAQSCDDEATMPESDEAQQNRRDRFRDDDLPVRSHEIVEVVHAQGRVDDSGEDDEAEGDERDRRIALDDRSEVLRLRQSSSEQGDDEESAQPDRRTEDVEPEA